MCLCCEPLDNAALTVMQTSLVFSVPWLLLYIHGCWGHRQGLTRSCMSVSWRVCAHVCCVGGLGGALVLCL